MDEFQYCMTLGRVVIFVIEEFTQWLGSLKLSYPGSLLPAFVRASTGTCFWLCTYGTPVQQQFFQPDTDSRWGEMASG